MTLCQKEDIARPPKVKLLPGMLTNIMQKKSRPVLTSAIIEVGGIVSRPITGTTAEPKKVPAFSTNKLPAKPDGMIWFSDFVERSWICLLVPSQRMSRGLIGP